MRRIVIDRIALELRGVDPATARALARRLGPALGPALAQALGQPPGQAPAAPAPGGAHDAARIDAGTLHTPAGGTPDTLAAAIAAHIAAGTRRREGG